MNNPLQPNDALLVKELIIGTWQWQETTLRDMGGSGCWSPESEGYTEQRIFLSNGSVEFYKDWKLIGTYPYKVGSYLGYSVGSVYELTIGEQTCLKFKVSSDKLVIGNGGEFGFCGFDRYYARVSESTMKDA